MTSETRFGLLELARSSVDAKRYANAHADLSTFHARRHRALAAAFDAIRLRANDRSTFALDRLASICVDAILDVRSPFSGYLEAPSQITDLYRQFGSRISETTAAAIEAIEDLLVRVIADLHGLDESSAVTGEDVRSHGFDPSTAGPDPIDYL